MPVLLDFIIEVLQPQAQFMITQRLKVQRCKGPVCCQLAHGIDVALVPDSLHIAVETPVTDLTVSVGLQTFVPAAVDVPIVKNTMFFTIALRGRQDKVLPESARFLPRKRTRLKPGWPEAVGADTETAMPHKSATVARGRR